MDGVVYVGSNDKNMYALDAQNGALKGKFAMAGPVISYPAFYRNYVIIAGGQDDNSINVLDRATLKPIFKYKTYGKIEADPVVFGDMFYVGSSDKQLYAFRFNPQK
jgi:outer membrane protein assembly factor BamB